MKVSRLCDGCKKVTEHEKHDMGEQEPSERTEALSNLYTYECLGEIEDKDLGEIRCGYKEDVWEVAT